MPLSRANAYQYQGCFSNLDTSSSSSRGSVVLLGMLDVNDCYEYAKSQSASFFGMQDGNICIYWNTLVQSVQSQGMLSDNQCYMDCGSTPNSYDFYIHSNNPKCGSQVAISVYQIHATNLLMDFKTDPTATYGNFINPVT